MISLRIPLPTYKNSVSKLCIRMCDQSQFLGICMSFAQWGFTFLGKKSNEIQIKIKIKVKI